MMPGKSTSAPCGSQDIRLGNHEKNMICRAPAWSPVPTKAVEVSARRDRCPTGIDGLDNILNGGIPRGNTIMLSGNPGTGKTSLSLEFLLHGAREGEKCVFIAATEPQEKLITNMIPYDFFDKDLLKSGKLQFVDLADVQKKAKTDKAELNAEEANDLLQAILEVAKDKEAERLVIDSITSVATQLASKERIRDFLSRLIQGLSKLTCTTLLVSEVSAGPHEIYSASGVEEAVVDGVIVMGNLERRGDLLRTLQVVKMRGTQHSRAKYILDLTSVGLLLAPLLKGGG